MNVFHTIKDFFIKTEVTEETFEYESIDDFLAKRKQENDNIPENDVVYKCDQIVDATYQMEDLRVEYEMVTSYFSDIQMIEELPQNVRQEVTDFAKKIAFLENETTQFLHSDDRISDENFRMIQSIEKDLSGILGRLKDLEDMDMKIQRDLKHLEGEKNAQEYVQSCVEEKQSRLRMTLLLFGTVSALLVLTLSLIGVFTETNLLLPVLLVILVMAVMTSFIVVAYRNLSYEFKMSELRENRAINLMNKIKIKLINNTSTLDYLYSKYKVKSLRELEYLYEQYLIMVDEVRKYQRSTGDLRQLAEALSKLLFSYGIKDPDIWSKQSAALVDSREMVEVKHSLNVRRQKLREQIAYNEELRLSGLKDIKAMLKENPNLREQVKRELELYHINM